MPEVCIEDSIERDGRVTQLEFHTASEIVEWLNENIEGSASHLEQDLFVVHGKGGDFLMKNGFKYARPNFHKEVYRFEGDLRDEPNKFEEIEEVWEGKDTDFKLLRFDTEEILDWMSYKVGGTVRLTSQTEIHVKNAMDEAWLEENGFERQYATKSSSLWNMPGRLSEVDDKEEGEITDHVDQMSQETGIEEEHFQESIRRDQIDEEWGTFDERVFDSVVINKGSSVISKTRSFFEKKVQSFKEFVNKIENNKTTDVVEDLYQEDGKFYMVTSTMGDFEVASNPPLDRDDDLWWILKENGISVNSPSDIIEEEIRVRRSGFPVQSSSSVEKLIWRKARWKVRDLGISQDFTSVLTRWLGFLSFLCIIASVYVMIVPVSTLNRSIILISQLLFFISFLNSLKNDIQGDMFY